ncbi:hypothetical protein JTE90_019147 [Oedothorax gibbosus]|uniref:Uncharacterized protein n=1 Tax=Oedothorax gibbosus TaxID=931172 RepID=A0AAV6UTY8_9ARAC|nr:hypothetical protein JTE90_019147 [Oedothorax gibbosus]
MHHLTISTIFLLTSTTIYCKTTLKDQNYKTEANGAKQSTTPVQTTTTSNLGDVSTEKPKSFYVMLYEWWVNLWTPKPGEICFGGKPCTGGK